MTNPRARYMQSRQNPPPPRDIPHAITLIHFEPRNGPAWLRCRCGKLMRARSNEALPTRFRDHRAACGLHTAVRAEHT